MRKLKSLWRKTLSPSVCDELETWTSVLLVLAAGLLLYATLTAQAARAAEFPTDIGAPTLLFQDGNRYVTANLSFDTHNPSRAAGYKIIGSQYFINDTFLSIRVPPLGSLRAAWNIGFFSQPKASQKGWMVVKCATTSIFSSFWSSSL